MTGRWPLNDCMALLIAGWIVGAARLDKSPRVDRIVISEGESARIANVDIRILRVAEDAVVHLEIAGAPIELGACIGVRYDIAYTSAVVIENRIPHPYIE